MTGPEHYANAEADIGNAARASDRGRTDDVAYWLAAAQVHATLALAAATALGREGGDGRMPARDRAEWFGVAAVPWHQDGEG